MRIPKHTVYIINEKKSLIKRTNIYVFSVQVRSLAAGKMCAARMTERMPAYILSVALLKAY